MHIDKEEVVDQLRAQGEHDKAVSAECRLPRHIDTEADAGLLRSLDVSISDLPQQGGAPEAETTGG